MDCVCNNEGVDRRLLVIGALPTLACGCGGSPIVADDASARSVADGSFEGPSDSPQGVSDAGQDAGFVDSPFELPDVGVPVACDAGDYYVTVNDGTNTQVLRGGCRDAGPDVPWIDLRSGGNVCDLAYLYACSPAGVRVNVVEGCNSGVIPAGPTLAPVKGTYDDGSGQIVVAIGAVRFAAAPPEGGTVPGGYVLNLLGNDGGGGAGSISGTFCVIFLGGGSR